MKQMSIVEEPMRRDAGISDCGRYRYWLTRGWSHGPMGVWIMLNPSTADAMQDDPPIRRCIRFSKAWGWGSLAILNLFAYRATNPAELRKVADPVGPECDQAMADFVPKLPGVRCVVAAWGAHGALNNRAQELMEFMEYWNVDWQCQCQHKTPTDHPHGVLLLN